MLEIISVVILVILLALVLNIPIAFALAMGGFVIVLLFDTAPTDFFIQTTYSASDSFSLLAIPFFILAGEIMSQGGIARRLIDFIQSMISSVTGGLGIVTIIASLIFAAISGSGAATVASIGAIMIPYMVRKGYDKSYASALAASAGSLGPIIPPSIVFILYGIMAGVSISDMFIAGILPGLLIAIALLIVNFFVSKKKGFQINGGIEKTEKKPFLSSLNDAKWGLLAPVIILGGIYGGIVTPTEAAVIAVVYSIIVSLFFYKEISFFDLPGVFMKAALTSGTIMIFVSTASFFGRILSLEQIPQAAASGIANITTNELIILLLINIFLLLVGMFMETVAAVILFVPLLLPIVLPLGVDPVHFGIIVCVNLSLGLITPPLGINLFIASRIANTSFESTLRYVGVIFVAILVVLMIITYIPQISLFLPELLS